MLLKFFSFLTVWKTLMACVLYIYYGASVILFLLLAHHPHYVPTVIILAYGSIHLEQQQQREHTKEKMS